MKRKCFSPTRRLIKLTAIGASVVATCALCWLPFLRDRKDAYQVLVRLFPFSRAIFEDKVANIWCALNVVVKLQRWNVEPAGSVEVGV